MTAPARIGGLFETHLTVHDLERSITFYRDVLGLTLAFHTRERGGAFFWTGDSGTSMLGLWTAGSAPIALSLHVAFATSLGDVQAACTRLRQLGVTPLSFDAVETHEPSVIAWMPAAAVYFRDPDGHLLEYVAMLDASPRPDLGVLAWSEWRRKQESR
jgi:lactoylglutathione lyase